MAMTHLIFYAMPDEQCAWLKGQLSSGQLWCVVRQLPPTWRIESVSGTDFLTEDIFRRCPGVGVVQLILGNRALVPDPVWRIDGGGGKDIDFIRSQAIQYDASILADHILLLGAMGIMSAPYYREAGIDPAGVQS
jgi:hypothetical protein